MARRVWIAYARIADIGAAALARTRNRLSPAERRHCARIATPRRRREFLAGRWLVETSRSQLPKDRWQRSIAHSGGWVACVLSQGAKPGIDIEPMVEREFAKLGAWAFPDAAGQPWSREAFYGRWTRYEAKLKAGPQRPLVDVTWFADGVALSVRLPWRAALQAGAPRRWRRRRGFIPTLLNYRLATLKGGDPVRDDQGNTGRQDSNGSTRSSGGQS